jgi:hypothetical protein
MYGLVATKAQRDLGERMRRSARILASSADRSTFVAGVVVDELVKVRVKLGISKQSILVTPDIVEHHGPLSNGDDQSALIVDRVPYPHFASILARPSVPVRFRPATRLCPAVGS